MKEVESKMPFRESLIRAIDWYYKDSGFAAVEETFKRSCVWKLEVAVKEVRPSRPDEGRVGRTIIVA
jgi:hypothetical protein